MLYMPKMVDPKQYRDIIAEFKGINRNLAIDKGELSDTFNMSARNLPVLSTRQPREVVLHNDVGFNIAGIYSLDKFAYVKMNYQEETSELFYGDTPATAVQIYSTDWADSPVDLFCQFQNSICIFNMLWRGIEGNMAMYDIEAGTITYHTLQSDADNQLGNFADVTVFQNRIVGVQKNGVHISRFNYATDFETQIDSNGMPAEWGAWHNSNATREKYTVVKTYKNFVVLFTENEMFRLYGTNAGNYDIVKVCDIGCVDRRAICEIGGILYFVSPLGVMAYAGGLPVCISDKLREDMAYKTYNNGDKSYVCALGADNQTLYFSITHDYGSGPLSYRMYAYDTITRTWMAEDYKSCSSFAYHNGTMYACDGSIYELNSKTAAEKIKWSFETDTFHEYTENRKIHSRIGIRFKPKTSCEVSVFASYDGGEYQLLNTVNAAETRMHSLDARVYPCDSFKLKIAGIGECDIYYIERIYTLGGRR